MVKNHKFMIWRKTMKINSKTTAMIGVFGVMMLGLTACGGDKNQETHATQTSKTQQSTTATTTNTNVVLETRVVAEQINSKLPDTAPTYKVLTTGSMPPYSFFNEKGQLRGLDIDAMQEIAEAGGFKVTFYTHPWQGLFNKVANGEYDMATSGISYTDERAKTYTLSKGYFTSPSAIMVMENLSHVTGLNDVKNLSVSVMKNSKQMLQAEQFGITKLKNHPTTFLAFQDVIQGNVDATLQDAPPLRYLAKQYPEYKVRVIPYEDSKEPSAQQVILMKKDNQSLASQVNKGIDTIIKNGKMKKIEEKWLGDVK